MFGTKGCGVQAYSSIGIETGVGSASRQELIAMLFDGALQAIANARQQLANQQIAAKGQSISKAISIIEEGLRASLDKEKGGEIAANLDALYDYISRQLLLANLNNDNARLADAQRLLHELQAAWHNTAPQAQAEPSPTTFP